VAIIPFWIYETIFGFIWKTNLFQQAVGRANAMASDDISVGEILVVSGEYQHWVKNNIHENLSHG
jgi:hypothetical protein